MTRPNGRTLLVSATITALLVLSILVVLLENASRFRPRLEAAASEAFGIQVRIGGPVRLGFGRGVLVHLDDVRLEGQGGTVLASVKQARLWLEPLALMRGTVRLLRIELVRPTITIEQRGDSATRPEVLRCPAALVAALDGASASVVGADVRYSDPAAGANFIACNVNLSIGGLRLADRSRPCAVRGLTFAAELSCDSLRTSGVSASAVRLSLKAARGVFAVEPLTLTFLGGRASGSLRADLTGAAPCYALRGSLKRFRIEQLLALQPAGPMVRGSMDLAAHLTLSGVTPDQLIRTSAGAVSLRGSQLTLVGDDLDRRLSRFESSQGFSLVDVGAAVLAGPVGLAVTRGYRIASLFRGSGGDSPIENLSSDWVISRGFARATDVAMATRRHRITLQGELDFVDGRYQDVTVAIVNPQGCATVRQAMHGDFAHPVVQRPRFLTSIAGPVLHLYRQARTILPGGPCDSYYAGSVPPPG
jgi:hypothetical protein